ncbi:MAG: transglutaminase domain-containing protein [Planctomycetes bacterium]|nr:transglutaminase domain-containing protein [Planctomycetota bacterium]
MLNRRLIHPVGMEYRILLVLAAWGFALLSNAQAAGQQPATKPQKEDIWQVIYISGQRIGYSHTLIETVEVNGKPLVHTMFVSNMALKRFNKPMVVQQSLKTEETLEGELVRYVFETANPPAATISAAGVVEGTTLKISQTVDGKVVENKVTIRPGVKSPNYHERALRANPMKPGETRSFEAFMPEFNAVATIKLQAGEMIDTSIPGGKSRKLLRVRMTQSVIPGVIMTAFMDDAGESVKVSTEMLGLEMQSVLVTKDEALKAVTVPELDLAVGTLVKVKPIPNAHGTKRMRYRVTTSGTKVDSVIATGETQAVKMLKDDVAEVTVTALPLPETAQVRPVAAEYLASTQYLQITDAKVKELADKAVGDATNPAEIARRMERFVYEKLSKKDLSTAMASAAEVARTMGGDCTEHAVLLAAMLRAKGIPSRCAVGFVYVEKLSAFGGHMWTEANLDGHWIPLDATLGKGGIGAAHLKLLDTSLKDEATSAIGCFAPLMVARLQIEVLD